MLDLASFNNTLSMDKAQHQAYSRVFKFLSVLSGIGFPRGFPKAVMAAALIALPSYTAIFCCLWRKGLHKATPAFLVMLGSDFRWSSRL